MEKREKAIEEEVMKKFKEYEGNPTVSLRNEIIEMNVPLVSFAVKKYLSDIDVEEDELISIGYFGLISAIETYDPDYGAKFSTYAIVCILNQIKNDLSTVTDIKMVRYNYPILKAKDKIERTTGVRLEDNLAELDSILDEDASVSEDIKKKLRYYMLTRDCKYNEHTVKDTYEIEDDVNTKIMLEKLRTCLLELSEVERKVLELKYGFFGINPTGTDMGNYLGYTRQNVSIIEKKALKKLLSKMNCRI